MDSTLVHLVIFFTIGAAIGYLTYLLSGSRGRAPKYIWWMGVLAIISFWIVSSTGLFTKQDLHTHWPMAISVVSAICIVVASFLYWYLRKKGDHSS
ncbi:MAG: hypothetical protein U0V54_15905 [Saprospiraceae bacterium]|nr:hypothetical protein [Saprospiraceae bacterium]